MGHEGQGVGEAVMSQCALKVAIPQPGGEESLNVAAAAAALPVLSRCDGGCEPAVSSPTRCPVCGMGLMGERSRRSPYNVVKLTRPLRDAIGRVGMVNMEDAWTVQ